MRTVDLRQDAPLQQATAALIERPPDYLVVTTGMGLRMWLEASRDWGDGGALTGALSGARIVARGAKAASAVKGAGLPLWWKAPHETMEEIVEHLRGQPVDGARIAVQLFDPGGHPSTEALRSAAAELVEVPVYRWQLPADCTPALRLVDAAVARELRAVTFTSQPAVHHLFRIAADAGQADALRAALNGGVLPACIGPVCAEAAREEGIERPVWPEPPRLPAMVRQLGEVVQGAGGN
jgi:uroporphyrinogen-III synthase